MYHYVVKWEIDVWADNPVDAARDAQAIQQQSGSNWFFNVTDDEGVITKVDLELENTPGEISIVVATRVEPATKNYTRQSLVEKNPNFRGEI